MQTPISITGISSVSSLGITSEEVWASYLNGKPSFQKKMIKGEEIAVSSVSEAIEAQIQDLRSSNSNYEKLDRSVLLAMLAARNLKLDSSASEIGINLGSSRGATETFEGYHSDFLNNGEASTLSSPTTTLGNISSWVAQDLQAKGPVISHSVTCSTALHSILNAIAWMQSGMAQSFIVGGAEAPLTKFTIAQMQALKLYSKSDNEFGCESMKFDKKSNSMVLGESAAVAMLEKGISKSTLAVISGFGFASEVLTHPISLSADAKCFQHSMQNALNMARLESVDVVIMHAPGTVKGDTAELAAINVIFKNNLPLLTSNKQLVGHTLGASGMMSVEMALLMLKYNRFVPNRFYDNLKEIPKTLKTIMINAVGFGGNAVSVVLSLPVRQP